MKTAPVIGGWTEFFERLDVLGGGITEIAVPAILGIFFGKRPHSLVPVGLGQHGSGGDGGESGVSVNDGLVGIEAESPEGPEFIAVYQQEIRSRIQSQDGPLHPGHGCP